MSLKHLQTLFILLMENRSFDHVLGHLSLPPYSRTEVEGLKSDPKWLEQVANSDGRDSYPPFHLEERRLPSDPPHTRGAIQDQLGARLKPGLSAMDGFAASYASVQPVSPNAAPSVMGYHTAAEVPVSNFFAQSFGIFDHWFSALPAGTQANRLMAMSGISMVEDNVAPLPDQELVYDWLDRHNVRWRVYSDGLPFFALMPRWWGEILSTNKFRPFDRLIADLQDEKPEEFPQVVFLEPTYTDAPHRGDANDDHPPSSVSDGQEFLRQAYLAVTSDRERWKTSALFITYDEHGGFFDHVSPPEQVTVAPAGAHYAPYTTLGVRVPAFVISPYVSPRRVVKSVMDHTSLLKLLGEKFGGGSYSKDVDFRTVFSASEAFDLEQPRDDIPSPPLAIGVKPERNVQAEGFRKMVTGMAEKYPDQLTAKYPELRHATGPVKK